MEHINGVWIPIGIFVMFLLGWVIKLMGTAKVARSHGDDTPPHADYLIATRPLGSADNKANSDEQETFERANRHVATTRSAQYEVTVRHSVANHSYIKQYGRNRLADACNPLGNHRSNQLSS